jgi:hypothetical protein
VDRHRLEQIRRSLAMSPSLPADVAQELASALARILDDRDAIVCMAVELERLAADLRRIAS